MVAVGGARLPDGGLPGEPGGDRGLVLELLDRHLLLDHRKPGLVGEEVLDRHPLLAVRGELGPHLGDGAAHVDQPALGEDVERGGRDRLGAGVRQRGGVTLPRPSGVAVGHAVPQVHDRLAVEVDGEGGAQLLARGEVAFEDLAHPGEPGVAVTVSGHSGPP